jgi:hypothetical protein
VANRRETRVFVVTGKPYGAFRSVEASSNLTLNSRAVHERAPPPRDRRPHKTERTGIEPRAE